MIPLPAVRADLLLTRIVATATNRMGCRHDGQETLVSRVTITPRAPALPSSLPLLRAAACSRSGTRSPADAPGAVSPSRPAAAAGTRREHASAHPRGTAAASLYPPVLR